MISGGVSKFSDVVLYFDDDELSRQVDLFCDSRYREFQALKRVRFHEDSSMGYTGIAMPLSAICLIDHICMIRELHAFHVHRPIPDSFHPKS